jgi:NAD(P)-dependent dehydrogenase (short-subunit alcohol dehydrogenase family)
MSEFVKQLFSIEGKTIIVTGASRGIGSEIALSFKKSGANLVCVSRSGSPSEKLLVDNYKKCDVSDSVSFESLCQYTVGKYKTIDVLVNAAGIARSEKEEVSNYQLFDEIISTNLAAVYRCSEAVSKYMTNGGSIVNITSIGSLQGFPGNPGYIASKGGLRMLSKSLALDLSKNNIRVNNIAPGYISTDMTKSSYSDPAMYKDRLDRMMIQRWGQASDIVGAAIFLSSNASSYITGSDIVVDGGWTAKGL